MGLLSFLGFGKKKTTALTGKAFGKRRALTGRAMLAKKKKFAKKIGPEI